MQSVYILDEEYLSMIVYFYYKIEIKKCTHYSPPHFVFLSFLYNISHYKLNISLILYVQ